MYTGYCNEVYQQREDDRLASNSITLDKKSDLPEVRADIQLDIKGVIEVKGILKDCQKCPIVGECIKLLCKRYCDEVEYYELVAETLTDMKGRYTIEVCAEEGDCFYVIAEGQPIQEIRQDLSILNNSWPQNICGANSMSSNMVESIKVELNVNGSKLPSHPPQVVNSTNMQPIPKLSCANHPATKAIPTNQPVEELGITTPMAAVPIFPREVMMQHEPRVQESKVSIKWGGHTTLKPGDFQQQSITKISDYVRFY